MVCQRIKRRKVTDREWARAFGAFVRKDERVIREFSEVEGHAGPAAVVAHVRVVPQNGAARRNEVLGEAEGGRNQEPQVRECEQAGI